MRVAVLGSGPAGLLAAHACVQQGVEPKIYSLKEKSLMFGAMYLHEPIPDLNDPDRPDHDIMIVKEGTREGYAKNVYGDKNVMCACIPVDAYKDEVDA